MKEQENPYSVAVYCGSSENYDKKHFEEARELARHFVKEKIRLVYGASSCGIMGAIGGEVLKQKGAVWGVITRHLVHLEKPYENLDRLIVVENMSLRKEALSNNAHALVVLPGGIGTLEEFFEVLVAKQLGVELKPILILNSLDYWDPLISLIDHLNKKGAIEKGGKKMFEVYENVDLLKRKISELKANFKS